jgi:hypothetical protein
MMRVKRRYEEGKREKKRRRKIKLPPKNSRAIREEPHVKAGEGVWREKRATVSKGGFLRVCN